MFRRSHAGAHRLCVLPICQRLGALLPCLLQCAPTGMLRHDPGIFQHIGRRGRHLDQLSQIALQLLPVRLPPQRLRHRHRVHRLSRCIQPGSFPKNLPVDRQSKISLPQPGRNIGEAAPIDQD